MLEHLRERSIAVMAQAESVMLASYGPADLQSDMLPCRAAGQQIYLLVPRTSDHLLNIEHHEGVLLTALSWQMRGRARILAEADVPTALQSERLPETAWSVWVAITPLRLTLFDADKKWFETIDFR